MSATPVAPIVIDTTPPGAPPGLTATAGDRQVALSWGASSDNIGVTGYDVYRGAVLVASPAGTSYTDTGPHERDALQLHGQGARRRRQRLDREQRVGHAGRHDGADRSVRPHGDPG